MWHLASLDTDTKTLLGMGENLVAAEKTLPKTSPTHTIFVQTATEGLPYYNVPHSGSYLGLNASSCSRVMEKSRTSIYYAKNSDTEHTFASLQLPPQRRDKLIGQKPLFKKYIATLPTRSGVFDDRYLR